MTCGCVCFAFSEFMCLLSLQYIMLAWQRSFVTIWPVRHNPSAARASPLQTERANSLAAKKKNQVNKLCIITPSSLSFFPWHPSSLVDICVYFY